MVRTRSLRRNLNLLYLQSTALTEPVLLAFMVGAIYHLACWMRTTPFAAWPGPAA